MAAYAPPLADFAFVLHDVLGVQDAGTPGYAELDRDFTAAILEEAGKIARDVLAPLNPVGDREGCRLENGVVRTPAGFKDAFDLLRDGGWTGLDCRPGLRRPGRSLRPAHRRRRDAVLEQHGLQHVLGPDPRRLLRHPRPRHARAEGGVAPEDGELRVDRHDEPDRAARRHRPRDAPHPRRAAGRRQLSDHRPEDLHLRRRPRPRREHRPPRARAASPARPPA